MSSPKSRGAKLGRGLSALLGDDTVEIPHSDTRSDSSISGQGISIIPVEFLVPSPLQPRRIFSQEEIDSLATSIKERGILQPILARPNPKNADEYEIIAGERRWRAAQAAQLHEVPVMIKELNDEEVLEVALIENIQRADLNILEEALGYRRLIDEFSHTQDSLAEVIGKSRSQIANTLRLLTLPDGVKSLLENGKLSAGHARALIGAANPKDIADEIIKRGLNVRQTEKLVKASKSGTESPRVKSPQKDPDTLALERSLTDILGLTVEIDFNGSSGIVAVNYSNLDQLDDIIRRLSD
ncbi:MAG: chromosome partitioning protein ParB [Rhodospirillaceae bacterium]|nr:chromosome partitioning protein ParB [Rhodospirillaceae bacterium]|tara:strand:+ start:30307 stop:31200 length:894 start_codon:yes stop_codon:yes gene_type:complete